MATEDKAKLDVITRREKAKLERTNRNLSTSASGTFKDACTAAGVPNTARQASKFNNGYGAAFRAK